MDVIIIFVVKIKPEKAIKPLKKMKNPYNTISKLLLYAVNDEISGKFSMLYWNKKEAMLLLQMTGLQLPGNLVPRDGLNHSI